MGFYIKVDVNKTNRALNAIMCNKVTSNKTRVIAHNSINITLAKRQNEIGEDNL